MKKILKVVIVMIFFLPLLSTAQHYRVGAGGTVSLPNDNLKTGGGLDVFTEYLTQSPLSFRTNGGFTLSRFDNTDPHLNDVTFSVYWIEGSLMYYFYKNSIDLYAGGGLGYYIFSHSKFNEIHLDQVTYTLNSEPNDLSSRVSFHIKAGAAYDIHKSIKVFSEVRYVYLRPKFIVHFTEVTDATENEFTTESELNLDLITITAGVILRI